MKVNSIIGTTFALALLAACGEPQVILPGERLDIRDGTRGGPVTQPATLNEARPISLPAQVANADWGHRNGSPAHRITHPALGPSLTPVFAADIGQGDSRRARITADPVVSGNAIYTLDSRARVTATSTSGQTLWTRDVTPSAVAGNAASGGGLAVAGGRLIVTSGFGRVTALDPATGASLWVQELDAPGSAAPTISGDLVYVVARDSRAFALDLNTGRVRWQISGAEAVATFGGGAGAAVAGDVAVFPFPSGEVVGAFPQGGLQRWSTVIAGQRPGQSASFISDIAGDPVIDGNRIYVGNVAGRVAALDTATGSTIWTANDGAVSPVWPVGGSVYVLNDLNQLVRLDASNGQALWRTELPRFTSSRLGRQSAVFAHFGPILAGGRLIVASSDGAIRQFDPTSGALVGQVELPGGAASNPVVANGTLYVVTKRGQLIAFR